MKKIVFLFVFLLGMIATSAFAQSYKVQYDYDAAGNRISRMVITIPPGQYSAQKQIQPLKQIWGERKILIYPNPTKGALKIAISNGAPDAEYKAKTYDQNGRVVCSEQRKGDGDIIVNLSEQASGTYILVLSAGSVEKTYKIIKE